MAEVTVHRTLELDGKRYPRGTEITGDIADRIIKSEHLRARVLITHRGDPAPQAPARVSPVPAVVKE